MKGALERAIALGLIVAPLSFGIPGPAAADCALYTQDLYGTINCNDGSSGTLVSNASGASWNLADGSGGSAVNLGGSSLYVDSNGETGVVTWNGNTATVVTSDGRWGVINRYGSNSFLSLPGDPAEDTDPWEQWSR